MHDLVTPLRRPVTERMLFDSVLRSDLNSFIQKAFTTVSPGDGFSANWHIEAMAHELTMMMRGENRRLIITIPPRHLKSICTSVAFPAFLLGHDPTRRIICVSYSQELAVKHANDCRRCSDRAAVNPPIPAPMIMTWQCDMVADAVQRACPGNMGFSPPEWRSRRCRSTHRDAYQASSDRHYRVIACCDCVITDGKG
jgi:hypothetical protein